jgi:hypothetical protein
MQRDDLRTRLSTSVALTALANQCYILAVTILLSGVVVGLLPILAVGCWLFSLWAQGRRPKLLVLRRFGANEVDDFLREAIGGLGMHARALWLYDARISSSSPKHTFNVWAMIFLPIAWLAQAFTLLGQREGNLPYELMWLAWIIIASVIYHLYRAGASPTAWIACVAALVATVALRHRVWTLLPSLQTHEWLDCLVLGTLFLLFWVAGIVLLRVSPAWRIFFWMYRRRVLATNADWRRYVRELRGIEPFPRFLSTASVHVAEVICSSDLWADAVYESIGYCSIVVADVSNLQDRAALAWELEQVRLSGAPVLLTCVDNSISSSRAALAAIGFDYHDLFVWKYSSTSSSKRLISYDPDALSACYFDLVRRHQLEELAYLPIRPSRAEAVARWKSRETPGPVKGSKESKRIPIQFVER